MFEVIVKKTYEFCVTVKGFSKLDSLVSKIKVGTYQIKSALTMFNFISNKISSTSSMIIAKIDEILSLGQNIEGSSRVENKISSLEKMTEENIVDISTINVKVSSTEAINNIIKQKLVLLTEPIVGRFKKLAEHDNIPLIELENLTLEEMDFVLTTKINE